jgi:hypothetical protein
MRRSLSSKESVFELVWWWVDCEWCPSHTVCWMSTVRAWVYTRHVCGSLHSEYSYRRCDEQEQWDRLKWQNQIVIKVVRNSVAHNTEFGACRTCVSPKDTNPFQETLVVPCPLTCQYTPVFSSCDQSHCLSSTHRTWATIAVRSQKFCTLQFHHW